LGEKKDINKNDNQVITHGICPDCLSYFRQNMNLSFDKFLNRLEAPVLMIDADGTVQLANDKALDYLDKSIEQVRGFLGGDVMECAYARLPEGCGNTTHCAACTIRNNVMKTHETGQSLKRVPAFLNRQNRDTIDKIKFLISTEKLGDVVLLRLDEVL
jgi:PAS domain-containing protein